jgi:xanthine dehydrogenase YagS FAD-binding subunit
VAVSPSDIAPALVALDAKVITNKRRILAEHFFTAAVESSTVLEQGEIVTGVFVPDPPAGSKQRYQKFRTRKTIDFSLASVASVITEKGGNVTSARIVLGGAAPVPYRARVAEAAVVGRSIDAATAAEAADAATKDMLALAENAYKVQVLRALVRRAVAD